MNNEQEHRRLRRTGTAMMVAGWVLLLGLMTLFFDQRERDALNPNQDPRAMISQGGVREVVLKRNRHNHYVASGTLNGQKVEFLLDTGASDVVVPAELAARLNLERGPSGYALTANGRVRTYRTRISELRIGNIVLNNVRASINTGAQDTGVLLGMSALKDVEFIQRGDELTLRQYPG